MSSSEEQSALIDKQQLLNLQMEKMIKQSLGSQNYAPKNPMSTVDEEAIREYNKQFKPIVYKTITDEHGNKVTEVDEDGRPIPITQKNNLVPPNLDPLPEPEVLLDANGNPFNPEVFKLIEDPKQVELFNKEVNEAKLKINRLIKHRENLIEQLNRTPSSNKKRIEALGSLIDKTDAEVGRLHRGLDELGETHKRLTQKLDEYKEIEQRNRTKEAQVKKRNEKELNAYTEAINILNKGSLKMVKELGETEEDYLNRLKQNAEIETIDETLFEAKQYLNIEFKKKLKELVRNDSIIETVSNEFKTYPYTDEDDIKIKTEILKTFPKFKSLFLELYGINNPIVTASDIIQFIKSYINGEEQSFVNTFLEIKKETGSKAKAKQIVASKENAYKITNPENGRTVYFMPMENEDEEIYLLWSLSGERTTFREITGERSFKEIRALTGLSSLKLKQELSGLSDPLKKKEINKYKKIPSFLALDLETRHNLKPITYASEEKPFKIFDVDEGEEIYGWGVKPEVIPEEVPFGKLRLKLNKLYYKNMLIVKLKDGSNVIGLPNTAVSDEFVRLIMKVVKGDKIKNHDIATLKTVEQHLYNRLIVLAELSKKLPVDSEKTISHLKHRLEILIGETESGNDNKALFKEIHQIVHSLKNFGAISPTEANKFLKQLK